MHRSIRSAATLAALFTLGMTGAETYAQAPAPVPAAAPVTFWNRLGIPSHPLDAIRNRGGNFPECERTPALKAIADPANMASGNAAIKKAAEIKAQEDMAAQKIKAIKYLAEIGCGGCYKGVDKALAEALDDCTEAVRYEAVKAIIAASSCGENECVRKCVKQTKTCKEAACDCWVGCMKRTCATMHLLCGKALPDGTTLKSKCPGYGCGAGGNCPGSRCACGDGNCCTSEILNKLSTMAFERDDRGCWKEPSPRVRAMARQALRACRPNIRPMTDADIPVPEEVPLDIERVPVAPRPEVREEVRPEPRAADGASVEEPAAGDETSVAVETAPQDEVEPAVVATTEAPALVPEVASAAETAPVAAAPQPRSVLVSLEIPVAPAPEDLLTPPAAQPQPAHAHGHRHHARQPNPTATKTAPFQFLWRR